VNPLFNRLKSLKK